MRRDLRSSRGERVEGAQGPPNRRLGRSLLAGIVAGILGAAVMAMVALTVSALRGQEVSTPIELVSTTLGARRPDFLLGALAFAVHLGIGALWGLLFGALLPWHAPRSAAIAAGLLYAVAVWSVMTFGGMPWAAPHFPGDVHPGWLLLFHSPYGLTLGYLTPSLRGSDERGQLTAPTIERRAEG